MCIRDSSEEEAAELASLLSRLEHSSRSAVLEDGLDPGETDPITVG